MKKVVVIVTSIVIASVFLIGCGKESSNGSVKGEASAKYIIATDAPFEFEKDGKYIGIDIDILNAIAKIQNFEYELKPMDFKGIIPALQANQVDGAIAGMSITEERKKILDMSDEYYESGIAAVAKKGNGKFKSLEDAKGKTFAVKKGTAGSAYAEKNKDNLGVTINYFNDTPSMFQEVKNGNADITFEDYPVIAYMITVDSKSGLEIVGEKLTKSDYGFAVKKGANKELLDKFNEGLKKIKENGEYDKIIAKYIKK